MDEVFKAATQYSDFKGTAAADDHDNAGIGDYLRKKDLLQKDEIVIGVQMYSGEVHTARQDAEVFVQAYIAGPAMDSFAERAEQENPVAVRMVRLEMHLNEFFGLFKRFEIMISRNGVLTGKNVHYPD